MKHDLGKFDLSKQQVLDLIDAYIFNERNRQIVTRRLIDGVLYEDLADEYGLSVNQVKTVCYKAIEKISAHIYTKLFPYENRTKPRLSHDCEGLGFLLCL